MTIVSTDQAPPCDRPNLSKDYLAGTAPEEWIPLRPPEFYAENGIELRLGTAATAIDVSARRRGGRKRALGTRRPMVMPLAADQRWSLDFVSDQLTDGRRFRILAVVDDCTRECLALIADTSISGRRVARELDNIVRRRGRRPDTIVSDNGTELTSNAILGWADETSVGWHYIAPGKP